MPTPEQKGRIQAIIDRIEANPAQFQMSHFLWDDKGRGYPARREDWPCGTTACIAGHACLDAGYVPEKGIAWGFGSPTSKTIIDPATIAGELLGLPRWVFYAEQWPPHYLQMLGGEGALVGRYYAREGEAQAACALLRELLDDASPLWESTGEEDNDT